MRHIKFLVCLLVISSCGGGGGGGAPDIPFTLTLAQNSFSTDEDSIYTGSVAASANETVTLEYSLTNSTSNGTLTFSQNAGITYSPNTNYFGQDQFTYTVTAVEKNITRSSTVNITINAVNDSPEIFITSTSNLDKNNLIFESNPSFAINYSDIDNEEIDLVFSASVNQITIPSTFQSTGEGTGEITLDLTSITNAGYFPAEIIVSDGNLTNSDVFNTWFIADKKIVTVAKDDDKSDGFDAGSTTNKDYYVYYLVGGESSFGRTDYLFVADSLKESLNAGTASDLTNFRDALLRSINALSESDISEFFAGYFDIIVAEPVEPDGTSLASIETGCYDWDEDVYCIGGDINSSVFDSLFEENDLVSVLTTIDGRGVNLGNTNIQPIGSRTEYVLMHELGHAHGEMGDEYLSDDDRDVSLWADRNVNTTTQSDPSMVKWKHHISDLTNVAGKNFKVCYNWSDGSVGLYEDEPNPETCDCLYNVYDANGNRTGRNPECNQVGLFEGNYYGEFDNYRPKFLTIMEVNTDQYGEVNVEGFAIGSIHNQGFVYGDDVGFSSDANGTRSGFNINIDVEYDTSKLRLKWYIDGVEDSSLENQTQVTFNRPSDNSVKVYTWRVDDLTGTVTAPDDVTNTEDFYEGLFNSYFYWYDYETGQWGTNPTDRTKYDYGYINGPMGGTWGINWERW